jgi:Fe-S-cluster containining protein
MSAQRRHLPVLKSAFADIDEATAELAAHSGLRCPQMCGRCCETAHVHTTAAELEAVAMWLVERGLADALHERAAGATTCALYEPHGAGRGRCSAYELRPAVCRLFGFAGRLDKRGDAELVTCTVHRRDFAQAVQVAEQQLRRSRGPLLATYQAQIMGLTGDRALLPINTALRRAIERVALRARLNVAGAR